MSSHGGHTWDVFETVGSRYKPDGLYFRKGGWKRIKNTLKKELNSSYLLFEISTASHSLPQRMELAQ